MWTDFLQAAIIISILTGMIRIATPILLASLGVLITDRSGVMNLGVEGLMLMGAYVGFHATLQTGSPGLGLAAAAIVGGIMSLTMVFMASTLKVDQTVTGLALNLLASGVSFYWYRVVYKTVQAGEMPTIETMGIIHIPLLSKIPVLGEALFSQGLLTYLGLALVPISWFLLYRTKYGLELRCLGENPRAIDLKGISVKRLQYLSTIVGGMLGGLGGAFLTMGVAGMFIPEISGGRGWLAIVAVIAGNWRPFRIMFAVLTISFLEAFQLQAQGLGIEFPYQILLALPYVVAIALLVISRAKSDMPETLGIPYFRD